MMEEERKSERGVDRAPRLAFALALIASLFAGVTLAGPVAPCSGALAAAPQGAAHSRVENGEVLFAMPGIEMEASARCGTREHYREVGLLQVVTTFRVQGRYGDGRVEVRVAALPALDTLPGAVPWYPAIRRQGTGGLRLTAADRPRGFMETSDAFMAKGPLAALRAEASFITMLAWHDVEGDRYVVLDAVAWSTTFSAEPAQEARLAFPASGEAIPRHLPPEEAQATLRTVPVASAVANRQLDWYWVPADGSFERRVGSRRGVLLPVALLRPLPPPVLVEIHHSL
jgi:hypothetical protein